MSVALATVQVTRRRLLLVIAVAVSVSVCRVAYVKGLTYCAPFSALHEWHRRGCVCECEFSSESDHTSCLRRIEQLALFVVHESEVPVGAWGTRSE